MEGLLFIVVLVVAFVSLLPKSQKLADVGVVARKEKVCPPHKWISVEVKDQNGTVYAERIVCKLCGPPNLGGE